MGCSTNTASVIQQPSQGRLRLPGQIKPVGHAFARACQRDPLASPAGYRLHRVVGRIAEVEHECVGTFLDHGGEAREGAGIGAVGGRGEAERDRDTAVLLVVVPERL